MTAKVEGQIVKVGDVVGFKSDVEQYGVITAIKGNNLTLKAGGEGCFHGDYIGGSTSTVVSADRCWID